MRYSPILRAAGGFWRRSLDELKHQSNKAIKFEAVTGNFSDLEIIKFRTPEDIQECKVFCDGDHGGFSHCTLELVDDPSSAVEKVARFSGNISIELPSNRPDMQRSGYAAWRTLERRGTLFSFGSRYWDIDPYNWLALRIKSDGSGAFVNLQTDGIVSTDIHQHRLFAKSPGKWETIHVGITKGKATEFLADEICICICMQIPFNEFVRTNYGQVVEPQDLLRHKLKTVGIGLIDRLPGPFEIYIDRIWATDKILSDEEPEENKKGPYSPDNI